MAAARIGGYRFISLVESFSAARASDFRRTVAAIPAIQSQPDGDCGFARATRTASNSVLSLCEIRGLTGTVAATACQATPALPNSLG
jgi:hypothetical protein